MDGKVVNQEDAVPVHGREHNGEYLINDLDKDAQTYNLDALLGNQSISSSERADMATHPTTGSLVGDGYVPIVEFQSNPAFNSIQWLSAAPAQPPWPPSGGSWRRAPAPI